MSDKRDTVAKLLDEGLSVAQIARATGLATNTVRYHRDRLGVAAAPPGGGSMPPASAHSAR